MPSTLFRLMNRVPMSKEHIPVQVTMTMEKGFPDPQQVPLTTPMMKEVFPRIITLEIGYIFPYSTVVKSASIFYEDFLP